MWLVKRLLTLVLLPSFLLLVACTHQQYYCGEYPVEKFQTSKTPKPK